MHMTPEEAKNIELEEARYSREGRNLPTINIHGRDTYNANTLRDAAHQYGIVSVVTKVVHLDVREGFAAVHARVTFRDGSSFDALGDASPDSVGNSNIAPHYVRMAETRAISRAFALAINADANASEEMPQGGNQSSGGGGSKPRRNYRRDNQNSNDYQQSGKDDDDWTDE
jgi:hypothetical protein